VFQGEARNLRGMGDHPFLERLATTCGVRVMGSNGEVVAGTLFTRALEEAHAKIVAAEGKVAAAAAANG